MQNNTIKHIETADKWIARLRGNEKPKPYIKKFISKVIINELARKESLILFMIADTLRSAVVIMAVSILISWFTAHRESIHIFARLLTFLFMALLYVNYLTGKIKKEIAVKVNEYLKDKI